MPTPPRSLDKIAPVMREYERFNTVCANAYVRPQMADYLARLQVRLKEMGAGCSRAAAALPAVAPPPRRAATALPACRTRPHPFTLAGAAIQHRQRQGRRGLAGAGLSTPTRDIGPTVGARPVR